MKVLSCGRRKKNIDLWSTLLLCIRRASVPAVYSMGTAGARCLGDVSLSHRSGPLWPGPPGPSLSAIVPGPSRATAARHPAAWASGPSATTHCAQRPWGATLASACAQAGRARWALSREGPAPASASPRPGRGRRLPSAAR